MKYLLYGNSSGEGFGTKIKTTKDYFLDDYFIDSFTWEELIKFIANSDIFWFQVFTETGKDITKLVAKKYSNLITKEYFKDSTGHEAELDDLDRCNCPDAGKIGHWGCGWCKVCNLPFFMCIIPLHNLSHRK